MGALPWRLGGVVIQASSELFFLPLPSSIPPELMPMLGHLLGTDLHTLSRLTWGELVSCPPDLGTLVGHFTLGSAHLVCASVCVYCCAICVPLSLPGVTLVGTLQWGHQGCNIYGLLHDS